MRNRGLALVAVAGIALMADLALLHYPPPPELGVAPEMFDWSTGWLGAILRVLSWVLVLAIVAGLFLVVRWIASLWHPATRPRSDRPARKHSLQQFWHRGQQ